MSENHKSGDEVGEQMSAPPKELVVVASLIVGVTIDFFLLSVYLFKCLMYKNAKMRIKTVQFC